MSSRTWRMVATEHATEGGISVALIAGLAEREYWYRLVRGEGASGAIVRRIGTGKRAIDSSLPRDSNPDRPLRISFALPAGCDRPGCADLQSPCVCPSSGSPKLGNTRGVDGESARWDLLPEVHIPGVTGERVFGCGPRDERYIESPTWMPRIAGSARRRCYAYGPAAVFPVRMRGPILGRTRLGNRLCPRVIQHKMVVAARRFGLSLRAIAPVPPVDPMPIGRSALNDVLPAISAIAAISAVTRRRRRVPGWADD